jgi:hypothetical protein
MAGRRAGGADTAGAASGWRLTDWTTCRCTPARPASVVALVARDQRLLRLPLALPDPSTTWRLAPPGKADAAASWPGR